MSEAKHTPGPWLKCESHEHPNKILICDLSWLGRHIAYMPIDAMPEGEQEANARLIAAAPEMLEALQQLMIAVDCGADETGYVDGVGFIDIDAIHDKARASIAKATGKEVA